MHGTGEKYVFSIDTQELMHLLELCDALLSLDTNDAEHVMGYPDDLKLRSCMTLFRAADPGCEAFQAVLDKFFGGQPDEKTLRILKNQGSR